MATPAQQILEAVLARDSITIAELLGSHPELANLTDRASQNASLLHHAARQGDLGVVELLLVAGANVNKRSSIGLSPLHEAAAIGHVEIVQALVAAGAETRATANDGHSAIDAARHFGHEAVVEILADLPRPTIRNTVRGKRDWS